MRCMNPLRGLFAIAAVVTLWAAPAFATEHCDHAKAAEDSHAAYVAQSDGGGGRQHLHHPMNAAAEEIPAGGINEDSGCQHHLGEACQCKTEMALSCGMKGCCIKADGPLSTGLSDRLPANDDHALNVQTAPPGLHGQMAVGAHGQMILPRVLSGPDPRPPSA